MGDIEAHTFSPSQCPIQAVTVYRDRAEVVRQLLFPPGETFNKEQEVKINLSTSCIDTESIRVKGIQGCNILEVSHGLHEVTSAELNSLESERIKELETCIANLKVDLDKALRESQRISNKRKLIQSFATGAVIKDCNAEKCPPSVDTCRDVVGYYSREMEELDTTDVDLTCRISQIKTELNLKEESLSNHSANNYLQAHRSVRKQTSVVIIIEIPDEIAEVGLELTYVVRNATWTPSYDIRVNSIANTMDLTYYAEVTQRTEEDWMDCKVVLSTSNPAVGSAPPVLPTVTVSIEKEGKFPSSANAKWSQRDDYNDSSRSSDDNESVSMLDENFREMDAAITNNATAIRPTIAGIVGNGDAGSTIFEVPRKVNIACDNKPHRVTITAHQLHPQMVHYVAPRVSEFVYIQAKTLNTSAYPMLASSKVSAFLDGNFIASTSLAQTASGEFFTVFLGVDPAVKAEYMPCRITQRTKGWITGVTEIRKVQHTTVLHNTKQSQPIHLMLADVLPRSKEEKVTVELLTPPPSSLAKPGHSTVSTASERDVLGSIEQLVTDGQAGPSQETVTTGSAASAAPSTISWPSDFVTQHKFTNNIMWFKTVAPGEKLQVEFTYKITWPQGLNINIA